jgi:hypothetical protein
MKAAFETIAEERGEPLRAVPFSQAFAENPSLCERLATVAAAVKTQYLVDKGWRFRVHEASLTFQKFANRHQAVKVLVDMHNELARKAGIAIRRNPVVVGVELTHVNPIVRESMRNYLSQQFGQNYLDPRAPREDSLHFISNDKYWIAPHNDHYYDMVFVPSSWPAQKPDAGAVQLFMRRLLAGLDIDTDTLSRL